MVERICSACGYGNLLEHKFCGRCGTPIEQRLLGRPEETTDMNLTLLPKAMPTELKQVGKAVALSLAALAAEAGVAWLRRRVERLNEPMPQQLSYGAHRAPQRTMQVVPAREQIVDTVPSVPSVTVVSQRVTQMWEQGTLTQQTVERTVWTREP